jgi:multimeric flavodoxin WrbA
VLAADGYLLGTTANFGYESGALQHFFDGEPAMRPKMPCGVGMPSAQSLQP